MLKMTAKNKDTGRDMVILALSHDNLDKLKEDGLNGFILIDGQEIGISLDIIITAGVTEDAIGQEFKQFIGPDTVILDGRANDND